MLTNDDAFCLACRQRNRSSFEEVLTWEEADAVLVTPVRHTGKRAICPLSGTPRALRLEAEADAMAGGSEEEEEEDEGEGEEEEEGMGEEKAMPGEEGEEAEEQEEGGGGGGHGHNAISEPRSVSGVEEHSSSPSSPSDERVSSLDEQSSEDEDKDEERDSEREGDVSSGTDGQADSAREDGIAEGPSFVYQRRKFVLKPAAASSDDGNSSDEEGVKETFGLVELPVEWPLRR